MKKNTTNILKIICLVFLFLSNQTYSKTINYYFDSVNGNDNNEGISIEKPFKTLKKIKEINLRSGDSILPICFFDWTWKELIKGLYSSA